MVKKQTSRPFAAAKANGPGRPIAQVGPRVVSQARYTCPAQIFFCFSLRTTPQTPQLKKGIKLKRLKNIKELQYA